MESSSTLPLELCDCKWNHHTCKAYSSNVLDHHTDNKINNSHGSLPSQLDLLWGYHFLLLLLFSAAYKLFFFKVCWWHTHTSTVVPCFTYVALDPLLIKESWLIVRTLLQFTPVAQCWETALHRSMVLSSLLTLWVVTRTGLRKKSMHVGLIATHQEHALAHTDQLLWRIPDSGTRGAMWFIAGLGLSASGSFIRCHIIIMGSLVM